MVTQLTEFAGLALICAFLVLTLAVWGVLAAGLLLVLVANLPVVTRRRRSSS